MTHRTTKTLGLIAALALALGLGLTYAAAGKPFSHAPHLGEKMACADCHDASGSAMTIKKDGCAKCHGEGPLPYGPPKLAPRALRAPFPHKRHADALGCTDCHKDMEKDALPKGRPFMTYDQCQSCHKENDIQTPETKCVVCHGADPRQTRPVDHGQAWKTRHGSAAEWRVFGSHGTDCSLCHLRSACVECHQSQKPQNHTALWRQRMHGQAASFDRERCKTCHETGSCTSCHQSTAPLNHHGNWRYVHGKAAGTTGNVDGCRVCHQQGCASCHQSGRK